MGGGGFEPPKQVAADLQSVTFGHSGIHPYCLSTINIYITLTFKMQEKYLQVFNYQPIDHIPFVWARIFCGSQFISLFTLLFGSFTITVPSAFNFVITI